jgi:cardiolipin synthase (CMP-forming)
MPDGSRQFTASNNMVTLPNVITLARLCAVPVAVWLVLRRDLHAAFGLFVAAGLSDAVDGWLARNHNRASAIGAILDPLADKALLVSMFVTLAAIHVLPDFIAIIVVFRDLLIVGGVLALYVLGRPVAIRPIMISKVNTALQLLLGARALLGAGFGISAPIFMLALVWLVAATTVVSGAVYVWRAAHLPLVGL